MNGLDLLWKAIDLAIVIAGFGLIIFLHELGHFVAAKWAGIRVLAFAMGFGPALVSWRKGLGFRAGSSETEYQAAFKAEREGIARVDPASISPSEYRLNWLPFGGYVKMLGQDDTNPAAISDAPDSYQRCPVWKRMIVISAGVVMNVLAAAALFVAVFLHGLETEPAKLGAVYPGKPASRAKAIEGPVEKPGLRAGDTVVSVDGRAVKSFNDLTMASAMSGRGESLRMVVQRPGVASPITFEVAPEESEYTRLREIGVEPARSAKLFDVKLPGDLAVFRARMTEAGTPELEPGMRLVRVGGVEASSASDLEDAVERGSGEPVAAEFEGTGGKRLTVHVGARPALQSGLVPISADTRSPINHLLGLVPVLMVSTEGGEANKPQQGLQEGDVFARLGTLEFPSVAEGIAEIKRHRGRAIDVDVLRNKGGKWERVAIKPDPVVHEIEGTPRIGFLSAGSESVGTWVALPPATIFDSATGASPKLPARSLITRPGTRITEIAGTPVHNFGDIRAALRAATRAAFQESAATAPVPVTLELPLAGDAGSVEHAQWQLTRSDIAALHLLGWQSRLGPEVFEPEVIPLRATGSTFPARAADAVRMGMNETRRVMLTTYMTFARLFQGTVKIEHLKGPVGIAHLGTRVLERGFIWLLFFMGLISINLAVVNFLPLPIVDGGQFVFLIIEQLRGKPVPVAVQTVATVAGLIMIGAVFLIVTFRDFMNLFG